MLKDLGVAGEVVESAVDDPATTVALRFLGSPIIQVNGADVEPSARSGTHQLEPIHRDSGNPCTGIEGRGRRSHGTTSGVAEQFADCAPALVLQLKHQLH